MKGFKERRALPVRLVLIRTAETIIRPPRKPAPRHPRPRPAPAEKDPAD